NVPYAHRGEAMLGEERSRFGQQPVARRRVGPPCVRRRHSRAHDNVRLKSRVAATMVSTEKIARYTRSNQIAAKPVFLSKRLFSPCTAYVNGSTTASARIHFGKACC